MMGKWKLMLCAGTALTLASTPAFAQNAAGNAGESINAQDIVVTARRSEEKLQNVPVAVSVITPTTIEAKGVFNPIDLATSAPGLSIAATVSDRNNLTFQIRGQGFAFGTLFPAVITYFNEVPVAQIAAGQFFDVANVQVLRGPQGVAFGRVTDGGNIMLTTQQPKPDFGGYVSAKVGSYGLRSFNGALNVPLVADKVLLRVAGETARRDGFTKNLYGPDRDNVAYEAYRGTLLIRPVDGVENTTTISYQNTHDNGTAVVGEFIRAGKPSGAVAGTATMFGSAYSIDPRGNIVPFTAGYTPFTGANFEASLFAQLAAQNLRDKRTIALSDPSYSKRKNLYVVNTTTFDVTDDIQIKNVIGYVKEKIDSADTFAAFNGGYIQPCHGGCAIYGNGGGLPFLDSKQISEELRISGKSLSDRLTWSLGGYMDEQKEAGPYENDTYSALVNRDGVKYPVTKSRAVYGSFEYEVVDHLKINGGIRYTHDTVVASQATYLGVRPAPLAQAALTQFLTAPTAAQQATWTAVVGSRGFSGFTMSAADAAKIVANTFQPVPHGVCAASFGGTSATDIYRSVLGTAFCRTDVGSFNPVTWQVGASYQMNDMLFYAKVSKGYRPGGVNGTTPAGLDPSYQPETDLSIEAGIKADWHIGGMFLRTNLAAYTDDYKSIQRNISFQANGIPVSQTANAANARVKGIEFESTFIPVEGITLGLNYAYTSAKYYEMVFPAGSATPTQAQLDAACDPNAGSGVARGFCLRNRFGGVPNHQLTLTANVVLPVLPEGKGELSVGGKLYHQSLVTFGDVNVLNPENREPGYTTVDLSANWRDFMGLPADLGFFMTNVTNKLYRIGTNNLSHNASSGVAGSMYAVPRMWGFSLKYRFGSDAQ